MSQYNKFIALIADRLGDMTDREIHHLVQVSSFFASLTNYSRMHRNYITWCRLQKISTPFDRLSTQTNLLPAKGASTGTKLPRAVTTNYAHPRSQSTYVHISKRNLLRTQISPRQPTTIMGFVSSFK